MDDIDERLTRLEAAVAALQQDASVAHPGDFWALEELQRRGDPAVLLTGYTGAGPDGDGVRWQYGRAVDDVLAADWAERASVLDALAHPVRLRLLQLIATGTDSTAELADQPELGTTGQLHHHLRQLVAAGWVRSPSRGRYAVVASRLIPLLVTMVAAEPA